MAYEDFNLNEKAMEEMALKFNEIKPMAETEEEQNSVIDEKTGFLTDAVVALKILQRLFLHQKETAKNQNLLDFISKHFADLELAEKSLSEFLTSTILTDLDFEPPTDLLSQTKMTNNLISGIIVNLTSAIPFFKDDKLILKIAEILKTIGAILKEAINL